MSFSSSNHGRQQSPSRTIRKVPFLVLNQKYSFMPVSGGVVAGGQPAYTGGRQLERKQDGYHAARAVGLAPGSKGQETSGIGFHASKNVGKEEGRA